MAATRRRAGSGTSLPITAAACSRAFAVATRGEDRLDGRGDAGIRDGLGQAVGPSPALQVTGLDQLADDLLDEERVAAGALADHLVEPVQRWVVAGEVGQQLPGGLGTERHQRDPPVDR